MYRYAEQSFDLVLDKATLDGVMSAGDATAKRIAAEVGRVLRPGGVLALCTHQHPGSAVGRHTLETVLLPELLRGASFPAVARVVMPAPVNRSVTLFRHH